ncbi:MAG: DUF721 domain-containing protein [Nitrospira sp.]|nr:DUF721 domain-containing protein [Nitrospira sp.]
MRGPGPVDAFGTILSGLAKRLGLESRLLELRLQRDWVRIVGEPMASHTWPDHIRFKKLHLIVRNSVWMQQLTFLKPALLAKLHEANATLITDLALRVGELPASRSGTDPALSAALVPTTEAALVEASAHASAIQDEELRRRLTQVMAEALSRAGHR